MARHKILNAFAVPAAGAFTSDPVTIGEAGDLTAVFDFDYGSGGTSLRLWLQTSFDGGTNWYDIISPSQFATTDAVEIYSVSAAGDISTAPTEGSKALAAATVQSGMIGDMLRVAGTVVGTYAASTITVIVEARQDAGGASSVGLDATSLAALESITAVPTSGSLTNRSGTIATGGAAQDAAAANSSRKYLFLLNPQTETEILWFSTVATAVAASPSIPLYPGQSFEMNGFVCSTGAVSVIAATTGHVFIAREG